LDEASFTPAEDRLTPALVLSWSDVEPSRIGEIAFMSDAVSSTWILGRGGPREEDSASRVTFVRQRPDRSSIAAGPLTAQALSRAQLRIDVTRDGLDVTSVGQGGLSLDGRPVAAGVTRSIVPGTVVMVGGHYVFLFVMRPAELPRVEGEVAPHDFGQPDLDGVVGESPAAWTLRSDAAKAARTRSHVFIYGESGTGKELVTRAIHRLSGRPGVPVSFNAATVTVSLAESILFGNVANYPNPGTPEHLGLFGRAEGGTLFLDEIGELGVDVQARLLRVLEGGEYERLGDSKTRKANVLVVAATNRDPRAIKHDVLKRFAFQLRMPSLAERLEDVPLLARALILDVYRKNPDLAARFVRKTADGKMDVVVSYKLVRAILRASYEGNVRDLRNLLLRAMTDTREPPLLPPADMSPWRAPPPPAARGPVDTDVDDLLGGIDPEAQRIQAELDRQGGNVTRAAKELGISREALYRQIRKHEMKRR
jgi:two-component system nitrogen regulation response regulator GlnG/two-component system response regulator HydG